ncbi:hypothetical protein MFIFM68171_05759 [Madurella fahalii]|uniref:DUF7580 domain-containing protein n=1 Tax=Madurella fahalii TaxID=1157608 RepID=A0ABQ0GCQ5_9PEZI
MIRGDQNQDLCELKLHNLNSLLCFLDSNDKTSKFTLITNPSTALFKLPSDEIEVATRNHLKRWKEISEQLSADLDFPRNVPQQPQQPIGLAPEGKKLDEIDKRASLVVSKMFDQFRQLDCARQRKSTHELRLRVSEELYTGPPKSSLDIFVSCCPNSALFWHEAQYESLNCKVETSTTKKTLCEAIRGAIQKRQRLHLQVGPKGLFEVTEEVRAEQLESDNFNREPLSELLKRQAFTPIRPRDVFDNLKTAEGKVRYHKKVEMALMLSKCLVDFFNEDFELPWTPSHIHLRRASSNRTSCKNRYNLYVSFRSETSEVKTLDLSTGLTTRNPILLSFAKLLLEIDSGNEISLNINPDPELNIPAFRKLIEYLDLRESETENPSYLRAVRGYLFASRALQISRDDTDQDSATRRLIRKELNEKIVIELERIYKPQSRLLQHQPPGDIKSKDLGTQGALQLTDISNTTVSLYNDQEEESKENRRRAKDYLDSFSRTFKSLRNCHPAMAPSSARPIRVAIIDSGLDMTDPVIRARAK